MKQEFRSIYSNNIYDLADKLPVGYGFMGEIKAMRKKATESLYDGHKTGIEAHNETFDKIDDPPMIT